MIKRAARALGVFATLAMSACSGPPGGSSADGALRDANLAPDASLRPDAEPWPQCADQRDNDGDGKIDYPFEPGCTAYADDDELDDCPDGPTCPDCSNGVDDSGDGEIDWPADGACNSAAGESEFFDDNPGPGPCWNLEYITATGMASGSLSGGVSYTFSPTCNGYGAERGYVFDVESGPVTLVVSTVDPGTTVDTVVYVRAACPNRFSELGCDDDGGGVTGGPSSLTLPEVPAGRYYIIVDSFSPGSLGDFVLTVTATSP